MTHENVKEKMRAYFASNPGARMKLWLEPMSGGACIHIELGNRDDMVVSNFRFVPPTEMSNLDIYKQGLLHETVSFLPLACNNVGKSETEDGKRIDAESSDDHVVKAESVPQEAAQMPSDGDASVMAVDIAPESAIIEEEPMPTEHVDEAAETVDDVLPDAPEPTASEILPAESTPEAAESGMTSAEVQESDGKGSEAPAAEKTVEESAPAASLSSSTDKSDSHEAEEGIPDADAPMTLEDAKNVRLEFKRRTKTVLSSPLAKYEGEPLSTIAPLLPSMIRFFALKADDPKCFVTERVSQASKILLDAKLI